ncbi:MAG: EamA family transporter RarD [Deltaproteobacteria bacterium]|nr:EamA family transporter RarD [Deltaproteobacteria bacterium]
MPRSPRATGIACALAAYGCWGIFPIYFKALRTVPPAVVLCHRVLWSAVVMTLIIAALGRSRAFVQALRSRKVLLTLAASTLLIAGNWLTYIYAVVQGHILESSLGYFVNPLVSVALGALFLRERLRTRQTIAVGLASCGVVILAAGSGAVPWIPLVLAGTFALYGLLRKTVAIDAAGGLLAETLFLVVPAVVFLLASPQPWAAEAMGWKGPVLLIAAGPVTALPLLCFAHGARQLPLSLIGFLQYLSPTLQFLTAVVVYGETFGRLHVFTFAFIWAGVALFLADAVVQSRRV